MVLFQGMAADAALVCNHNWAGSRVMQTKIEVFGIFENFVPTQSWV
jgi:hypothetical protein